jgi:hypothetical protein
MKAVNIVKQLTIVATLGLAFSAHAQLLGGRGAIGGMIGGSGAGGFGGMGSLGNAAQMTGRGSMLGSANSPAGITRSDSLRKSATSNADAAGNGSAGLLGDVNASTNTARTEGLRKSANANGEANGSGSASLLGNVSSAAPAAPALPSTKGAAPSAALPATPGAAAPAPGAAAPATAQGKGIGTLLDGGTANTAGSATGNADASGGGNATPGLGMSGGVRAVGSVTQGARNTAQPMRQGVQVQAETTRTFAQASGANVKSTVGQMSATGNARQIAGAARSVKVQPQLEANGSAQGSGSSSR